MTEDRKSEKNHTESTFVYAICCQKVARFVRKSRATVAGVTVPVRRQGFREWVEHPHTAVYLLVHCLQEF